MINEKPYEENCLYAGVHINREAKPRLLIMKFDLTVCNISNKQFILSISVIIIIIVIIVIFTTINTVIMTIIINYIIITFIVTLKGDLGGMICHTSWCM